MTPRRRLALAAAGLYGALIAVLTLWPSHPESSVVARVQEAPGSQAQPDATRGLVDVLGNVALYLPLGVLIYLAARSAVIAVLSALAMSASIETLQAFVLDGRDGSGRDIAANVAGAALGVLLVRLAMAAARQP